VRRPQGYATIVSPDAPMIERDSCQCGHCSGVVLVKPGTGATVYVFPQVNGPDKEEPGAFCRRCMRPVCLTCHAKGRCVPFEKMIDRLEARGRMLRAAGVG
jgi:hypothetical protein